MRSPPGWPVSWPVIASVCARPGGKIGRSKRGPVDERSAWWYNGLWYTPASLSCCATGASGSNLGAISGGEWQLSWREPALIHRSVMCRWSPPGVSIRCHPSSPCWVAMRSRALPKPRSIMPSAKCDGEHGVCGWLASMPGEKAASEITSPLPPCSTSTRHLDDSSMWIRWLMSANGV